MDKNLRMLLTKSVWNLNHMPHDNEDMIEVIVMAVSEGYAMVRRSECDPFIVNVNELGPIIE